MVGMYENGGSRLAWARATQIYGSYEGYVRDLALNYDRTKLVVSIRTTGHYGFIVLKPDSGSTFWFTNQAGESARLIYRFEHNYIWFDWHNFVVSSTSDRLYSLANRSQ